MRRRTIRNGMRLVLAALALIILASFFHEPLAGMLSLSPVGEFRLYRSGIFWAAALGGYGVVLAAFGLILPADRRDQQVRILPSLLMVATAISLFFYLLAVSMDPAPPRQERLRPGETVTI